MWPSAKRPMFARVPGALPQATVNVAFGQNFEPKMRNFEDRGLRSCAFGSPANVWPKACSHRSLGQRPRTTVLSGFFWPKAILTLPAAGR